jgi:hypothetical protein
VKKKERKKGKTKIEEEGKEGEKKGKKTSYTANRQTSGIRKLN